MRVVVLDYGSGNLRSAERALARVGADVTVTGDLDRARAAGALVHLGNPRGLEVLLEAMRSDDVEVRRAAVEQAGDVRAKAAFEQLVAALGDPDVLVRQAAAGALLFFPLDQLFDPAELVDLLPMGQQAVEL